MNIARLLALALLLPLSAAADSFGFALIGDMPYSDYERRQLPLILEEIGREKPEFVVHIGDIKSGSSVCSDQALLDIRDAFQASPVPLVYVLGDNEWTDCHRQSNGAYDPVERLRYLRRHFHFDSMTLGQSKFRLERQSQNAEFADYRENMRWQIGRILFVGLNVPGSNNNWGSRREASQEYLLRSRANRAWMAESFALARERKLAGIVIAIQANTNLESFKHREDAPNGYLEFNEQLRSETLAFPGQVLLLHGDTHHHRIDRPLRNPLSGEQVGNFTRVESYGSPFLGWVKVTADEADPQVFRFEPRPHFPPWNR